MLSMSSKILVFLLLLRFTSVAAHSSSLGRHGVSTKYWPLDDLHLTLDVDDRPPQELIPRDQIIRREANDYTLVKRALSTNLEVYERVRAMLQATKTLELDHTGTRQTTLDIMASFVRSDISDQRAPLNGQFWRLISRFRVMREREEREVRELLGDERSRIYRQAAMRFQKMADHVFWDQWHREAHRSSKHSSAGSTEVDKSTPGGPNRNSHSSETSESVKGSRIPPMGPATRQWTHPDSTWSIVSPKKTQKSQSKRTEP